MHNQPVEKGIRHPRAGRTGDVNERNARVTFPVDKLFIFSWFGQDGVDAKFHSLIPCIGGIKNVF
jgi:hypothetical protein